MRLLLIVLSLFIAAPALVPSMALADFFTTPPSPGAASVTATGGTTARSLADWFWGIDKSGSTTKFAGTSVTAAVTVPKTTAIDLTTSGTGSAADKVGHGALNGPIWNWIGVDDKYNVVGTLGPYALGVQLSEYTDTGGVGGTAIGGVSYLQPGTGTAVRTDAVGGLLMALANANLSGTGGAAFGNLYGANLYAQAQTGATFLRNVTGGEVNVDLQPGASARYVSGLQIVYASSVQGSVYDAVLSLSGKTPSSGGATIGAKNGILFSAASQYAPISATGTLIGTADAFAAGIGIDLTGATYSGNAIQSPGGFSVDGAGNVRAAAVTSPSFARIADASTPFQTNAASGGQGYFGADKGGAYGLLVGYNNSATQGGPSAQIRQITTDPLDIVVNNTSTAMRFASDMSATANGQIRAVAAGVGLAVTNNATIGGTLLTTGAATFSASVILAQSTVAALPACVAGLKGAQYWATDLTAPTYNGTLTGGGTIGHAVGCDGVAWHS